MSGHGYTANMIERFWAKVDAAADCWVWTGADNGKRKPYGCFYTGVGPSKGKVYVHRFSYMLTTDEPLPREVQVDHRCTNTLCVNPAHLQPASNRENLMRAFIGKRNAEHNIRRAAERAEARRARLIAAAVAAGDVPVAVALAASA